jgi:hypothetical protein
LFVSLRRGDGIQISPRSLKFLLTGRIFLISKNILSISVD